MFCPNGVFRTFNYKQLLMVTLLTMSLIFLFTVFVFTYVRWANIRCSPSAPVPPLAALDRLREPPPSPRSGDGRFVVLPWFAQLRAAAVHLAVPVSLRWFCWLLTGTSEPT